MYKGIKSCVSVNNECSQLFFCNTGVRQGENLSPVLFSLYLNDLENHLLNLNCTGVAPIIEAQDNFLELGIHLLCLLYADDTALLATNANDLQKTLNAFLEYCKKWKLKVNSDKTKVIIFNGNTNDYKKTFILGDKPLENVKEYKYLGLTFTKQNKFKITKKDLTQRATKAIYFVLSKAKEHSLPLDCKLKLFDSMVLPILLYGCEIWGYENLDIIENIHINFLRRLLPVKKSTPLFMLYGELGRTPLKLIIDQRIIGFWARIVKGKITKISNLMLNYMIRDSSTNGHNYKWLEHVQHIFDNLGMSDIFRSNKFSSLKLLIQHVKQRQLDQYMQIWNSNIESASKGKTYIIFKQTLNLENYFIKLPEKMWTILLKFRTSNHYLPIEIGRWNNIPTENRICTLCESNDIGDEYHYLFKCNYFLNTRTQFLKPYYYNKPSTLKFKELFNCNNISTIRKISKFIAEIFSKFSKP